MSESLRNDGRVWVPKELDDARSPDQIPEGERDYFLERRYPAFGNLVPRDVASRAAKREVDAGRGVGPQKNGVYLDFADAIARLGRDVDRGALRQPLRDVRAHHRRGPVPGPDAHLPRHPLHDGRALGRLQPDEQRARPLRARRGELLRPRRQPPRCRARSCRVSPTATSCCRPRSPTTSRRCSARSPCPPTTPRSATPRQHVRRQHAPAAVDQRQALGRPLPPRARQDPVGQLRHGAQHGEPREGAQPRSPRSARSSTPTCSVLGEHETLNQSLEKAGRVADFLEFGELLCRDALAPRGELRRPLPRRAPDRGRRGAARRRRLLVRRGVGVRRASGASADAPQGAARVRVRPPRAAELQVATTYGGQAAWISSSRVWRQAGTDAARRRSRTYDVRRRQPRHVVPRAVRRAERAARRRGPGADRVRPRLPRGHLRLVLDDDQRPRARPRDRHRHLPAPHAQVRRRRRDHRGAVARRARSRSSTTSSSTAAAFDRIVEAGGYITAPTGSAPDANLILVPEGSRRRGDGRRRVHRLRRVRGRVPERRRAALHRGEGRAPQPAAPGPARALRRGSSTWSTRWSAGSARARNHGECEKACPKEISIDFIALLNRDYIKAQFKNRRLAGQVS